MRWIGALLCLLTTLATAADLNLPARVQGEPDDFITIQATTPAAVVKWVVLDPGLKLFPTELLKDTRTAIVVGKSPGSYRVLAYSADASGPSDPRICNVVILGPPTPIPPPSPQPDVAPIPAPGFRVLAVYDTATLSALPARQQQALFGGSVRDYLNQKCIKGTDAHTPEWRMWDPTVDTASEGQVWKDALRRPRKSLPWLLISDGKSGYEGPLPASEEEMLYLLKKYGG